jgi:predicted Na+-dependent transporter
VVVAAAVGLGVPQPLRALVRHHGIDIALAVLVLATATTIEPSSLQRIGARWRPVALAVVAGAVVFPPLAWVVSHLVAAGPLREGMLTVGLAPCEIASVATTAMAGGEATLAAGVLVGSTAVAVVAAGPVLGLEAGGASLHTAGIAVNLLEVVVGPFVVGVVARVVAGTSEARERAGAVVATVAVAALVALIAAGVTFSSRYVGVSEALVVYLAASYALGLLLGRLAGRDAATPVLLTLSMRDFAIAASIAAAAFGPAAAAPLGLYGILVLVVGTATAGRLRSAAAVPG